MKRLLLLTSFLLTGCVSVPLAVDVVDDCNAQNFGQYYGNCIWETYEFHPNKDAYIDAYNYKTDWLEITQLNNMLLYSLKQGNISINDANTLFMARFSLLTEKDAARVAAENARIGAALANLGDSLNESNRILNGGNNSNIAPTTMGTPLQRQQVNGQQRICYYGVGAFAKTLVIRSFDICPPFVN